MLRIATACIVISIALVAIPCPAQVQVYHSQAGFESVAGAAPLAFPTTATVLPNQPDASLQDYSCGATPPGIDLPWGSSSPLASVQAPQASGPADCLIWFVGPQWNGGPAPPSPMIVANGEDDYRITFATPVHAVGFELFTNSTAVETVTLTFADDSTAVFADADLGTEPNSFPFIGFRSLKPIKALDIDTTDGAVQNEGILAIKVAEAYKVLIDIKPGSDPNSINLGSKGNVPVVIFGSQQFDVATIGVASIRLAGAAVLLRGKDAPMASVVDVNNDGFADLFVHIDTEALALAQGDTIAVLTATTSGGAAVYGEDSVRTVPPKK